MAKEVPTDALRDEVQFYGETDKVMHDINDFRDRLSAQNEEFNLLLDYYVQHRGKIDVHHAQDRYLPPKPNLGTDDESWYYLDDRGNKIWVRNMRLEASAKTKTGAFCETGDGRDGKRIVVTVPKHKKSYALPANYRRCCDQYDAHKRTLEATRSATGTHSARRTWTSDTDQYIEMQKALHQAVTGTGQRSVVRPPATIEEAEERLAQLRSEEERLRDAFQRTLV